RIANADVVVGHVADLRRHHEGRDARYVGLEREREQIEHQVDVLVEAVRYTCRRIRQRPLRQVARLEPLYAALDFPDALEVIVDLRAIARAERPLEALGLGQNQIEDALLLAYQQRPLLRGVALAEQ